MTVESDIKTALAAYRIDSISRADYHKPTTNSVKTYKIVVGLKLAACDTCEAIVTALQAMSTYKAIRARLVSQWPSGNLFYSRFEVDIQI